LKAVAARIVVGSALAALVLAPGALAGQESYFPLEEGNRWVYQERQFSSEVTVEVIQREGEIAELATSFASGSVLVRDGGDEVEVELAEEGFVLYYRFSADTTWEHRDPFSCDDQRMVSVTAEPQPVETPAGTFEETLRIDYTGATLCADAGKVAEWWAPGVGLVRWQEDSFVGRRTYDLVAFTRDEPAPVFSRGDANADGRLDVSDPVKILQFLFVTPDPLICEDAADVDDTGALQITDPIYLLNYLFRTGDAPPAPFPGCGEDPSKDPLACESQPQCLPD